MQYPDCLGQEAAQALAALLWRWHVKDEELAAGQQRRPPYLPDPTVTAD